MDRNEISRLLGLALKQVDQLAAQGVLERSPSGSFGIESITSYVRHLRTGDGVAAARAEFLRARTAASRLESERLAAKTITAAELEVIGHELGLAVLECFRECTAALYRHCSQIRGVDGRLVAGVAEQEIVAWIERAKQAMRRKTGPILARVADPQRVRALLDRLERDGS
jgi:hypothetical protein